MAGAVCHKQGDRSLRAVGVATRLSPRRGAHEPGPTTRRSGSCLRRRSGAVTDPERGESHGFSRVEDIKAATLLASFAVAFALGVGDELTDCAEHFVL